MTTRTQVARTHQVAIIGAGPAGLLLGQLLAKAGHRRGDRRTAERRARARPHPRRRARAGERRPPGRGRRRRAHAPRGARSRRLRDALARSAPPHRHAAPDRRQERDGLRPDRADARSDGGAPRRRPADGVRGGERRGARLRRRVAARQLRQGRHAPRARVRLHRRLRRLPRRLPRERPAGRDHRIREGVPVRLAGPAGGHAAGLARADLHQQPARLRALLDAQSHAQPLLPAGSADREGRELVRRSLLGRAATAPRRQGPRRARHRPVARKEHRAAAQLRRRAAALRADVPGRRRGPHRARRRARRV